MTVRMDDVHWIIPSQAQHMQGGGSRGGGGDGIGPSVTQEMGSTTAQEEVLQSNRVRGYTKIQESGIKGSDPGP